MQAMHTNLEAPESLISSHSLLQPPLCSAIHPLMSTEAPVSARKPRGPNDLPRISLEPNVALRTPPTFRTYESHRN